MLTCAMERVAEIILKPRTSPARSLRARWRRPAHQEARQRVTPELEHAAVSAIDHCAATMRREHQQGGYKSVKRARDGQILQ